MPCQISANLVLLLLIPVFTQHTVLRPLFDVNTKSATMSTRSMVAVFATMLAVSRRTVDGHGCGSSPINTLTLACPQNCAGKMCIYFDRSQGQLTSCDFDGRSRFSGCTLGDTCDVECFEPYSTASMFKFAVVSAASTQRKQIIPRHKEPSIGQDLATTSWDTDEYLYRIGQLSVPRTVNYVSIFGGSESFDTPPLRLAIDSQFLASAPQVTTVSLRNLQIGGQVANGIKSLSLPRGLTALDLANTQLTRLPSDLSTLNSLSNLVLRSNKLTQFDASLPNLRYLDLSSNSFTSIPSGVFKLNKLDTLKLDKNPIRSLTLTEKQYQFLKSVPSLSVDKLEKPSPKDGYEIKSLGSNQVLVSTREDDATGETTKAPSTDGSGSSTVPNTSSSTSNSESSSPNDGGSGGNGDNNQGNGTTGPQGSVGSDGSDDRLRGSQSRNGGTSGGTSNTAANETSDDSSSSERNLIIGMCVAVGFLAVIAIFVVRRRRLVSAAAASKAYQLDEDASALATDATNYDLVVTGEGSNTKTGGSHASRQSIDENWIKSSHFDLRSIRMAVREIEDVRVIGSSSSTVTWLVNYRKNTLFASKRLLVAENSIESKAHNERRAKFLSEVHIAAPLSHPSIVSLVGVAWTNESDLQVLYEYMANGDLQSYLADETVTTWQSSSLAMAIDTIEALVYAHSFNPPLVHRDLKSRNVLLDEEMKAKVACFGDARFASENGTMTSDGVGSSRWLAPEILAGSSSYDASADVYAFGVLLSELDTHVVPYDDIAVGVGMTSDGQRLGEMELLLRVARGELRPRFSRECPVEIMELAMECMSMDPAKRPPSVQVAYSLRTFARSGGFV